MPDAFTFPAPVAADQQRHNLGAGAVLALFGPQRPPLTMAVPVAERVRAALMRACRAGVPWQVSGKGADDRPRVGHDHLYLLPFCHDRGACAETPIDRVLVWARCGLQDDTRALLEGLAQCGGWLGLGRRPQLRLELLGLGDQSALGGLVPSKLVRPARVWRSATAFVPPRYCKESRADRRDCADQQLSRLAGDLLGQAPAGVEALVEREASWQAFAQRSSGGSGKVSRPGAGGWVLRFDRPVPGPVALGHHAHYGLGRFEAVRS